jgi:hypothetical protein
MVVFETASKIGKRIRLTEVQWAHMSSKHPELVSQVDRMVTTLEEPDSIYHSPGEDCFHYAKLFKQTPVSEKYLLLIVKHLNNEGFIITAFFVPGLKTKGKVLVYGKKNLDKLR